MGLIKEPLEVDFFTMPKALSEKERVLISKHINEYKAKAQKRKKAKQISRVKKIAVKIATIYKYLED